MTITLTIELRSVDKELPEPGEYVFRFGRTWPDDKEHWDVGQLVADSGTRWADWGVTHWAKLPVDPLYGSGE